MANTTDGGRVLAKVAGELYSSNVWVSLGELFNYLPRIVGTAVLDKNDLKLHSKAPKDIDQALM